MKKISILIIAYNSSKIIETCIESVITQQYDNFKLFIIDNSSEKATEKICQKYGTKIDYIPLQNIGYAGAINYGFIIANEQESDFILILNPDVILEQFALYNALLCANRFKKAHIVGFKQVKVFSTVKLEQEKMCSSVSWTCGCAMLINMNFISQIGYFDEYYFMYFEETDYIKRTIKKGYQVFNSNNSEIIHIGEESTKTRKSISYYYLIRNCFYFTKKNIFPTSKLKGVKYIAGFIKNSFWFPMHPFRFTALLIGILNGLRILIFKKTKDYNIIYTKNFFNGLKNPAPKEPDLD